LKLLVVIAVDVVPHELLALFWLGVGDDSESCKQIKTSKDIEKLETCELFFRKVFSWKLFSDFSFSHSDLRFFVEDCKVESLSCVFLFDLFCKIQNKIHMNNVHLHLPQVQLKVLILASSFVFGCLLAVSLATC
jgi:hypothetical protein